MSGDKQVALVTGASRGIGAAIADRLGAEGYIVLGTATTEAGAEKISKRFADAGISGRGYALDVCSAEQVDSVLKQMQEDFAAPMVLVNNAGITRDNLLLRMKDEEWDAVHETNLKAIFRLTKKLLRPMMKARYGRIINITSVVGATGNPGQANYVAMKAAVMGFSKAVAQEIATRGITVNCVAPGFIKTDMTDILTDEQRAAIDAQIPSGKIGDPDDIASAVIYLASSGAGYVTGQTIHVNGGMHMP